MAMVIILRISDPNMQARDGNFDVLIVKEALSASILHWKNINLEVPRAMRCCHMESQKPDDEVNTEDCRV